MRGASAGRFAVVAVVAVAAVAVALLFAALVSAWADLIARRAQRRHDEAALWAWARARGLWMSLDDDDDDERHAPSWSWRAGDCVLVQYASTGPARRCWSGVQRWATQSRWNHVAVVTPTLGLASLQRDRGLVQYDDVQTAVRQWRARGHRVARLCTGGPTRSGYVAESTFVTTARWERPSIGSVLRRMNVLIDNDNDNDNDNNGDGPCNRDSPRPVQSSWSCVTFVVAWLRAHGQPCAEAATVVVGLTVPDDWALAWFRWVRSASAASASAASASAAAAVP